MSDPRKYPPNEGMPGRDFEADPMPPWGCGELFGRDAFGDPMKCEWGNLCQDCEPQKREETP